MARVAPIQNNFNGGEISPLLEGRSDLVQYKTGLSTCLNFIPTVQGALLRRPGTRYVNTVKTSADATRLLPFEFSTTQAYMIESGDEYFRFYKDHAQIQVASVAAWQTSTAYAVGALASSGGTNYYCVTAHTSGTFATDLAAGKWYALTGTIYEIPAPYATADLSNLRYAQSADVLYLLHPDYIPRKLTRTGHTAWTLSLIDFQDGPYLATNSTATTMAASGATGSVTLTASAVTGINGGTGFQTTDVGRLVRIKNTNWAWGEITGRTSTTVVTVSVRSGSFPTSGTADWRLGLWSATTGYPAVATFYEDRLMFAGAPDSPQRLDGSRSGDYENFAPSDADGTVAADHAVAVTLNANDVNVVRWLLDDEKGLLVGTVGGEWIVRPSTANEALSPTNIKAVRTTKRGSANVPAVRVGKAALFVQRSGRRIREMAYVFEDDGFRSPDMTLIAEHITVGGITAMAVQDEPQPIVWATRGDGTLLGLTCEREQDVVGWHRHTIGGTSDADGTQAKVESIAVIPMPAGDGQDLWMIVQRWVNGAAVRHIEYLTALWKSSNDQEDAFFVDAGITYDGVPETDFSGVDHLEGETVSILGDGAVVPNTDIVSGAFSIASAASVVHAGYGYTSEIRTLVVDAGAADGTARGKTQRINKLAISFYETLGGFIGPDADNLDEMIFRNFGDDMGVAVPLYTGDFLLDFDGRYERGARLTIRQTQPLPMGIRAIMPQMTTQDAG